MEQASLLENRNDAAKLLGISLRKLDYLVADKKLKTVRIGKAVRIPRRALEEFIRRNTR